jgi:hypothetical protein
MIGPGNRKEKDRKHGWDNEWKGWYYGIDLLLAEGQTKVTRQAFQVYRKGT